MVGGTIATSVLTLLLKQNGPLVMKEARRVVVSAVCQRGKHREVDPMQDAASDLQSVFYSIGAKCYLQRFMNQSTTDYEERSDHIEELAYLVAVFLGQDQHWRDRGIGARWRLANEKLRDVRAAFGWSSDADQTFSIHKVMRHAVGQAVLLAPHGDVAPPSLMPFETFSRSVQPSNHSGILRRFFKIIEAAGERLSTPEGLERHGARLVLLQHTLIDLLVAVHSDAGRLPPKYHSKIGRLSDECELPVWSVQASNVSCEPRA